MDNIKLLLKSFSERPVAYYPVYAKITGSITAGILLSQCCYWFYASGNKEFYKTDKEFCDDLSMGLYELKSAKKRLQELGLISLNRKGIPAKTYYLVNEDKLITLITSYGKNPQLDSGKTTNLIVGKPTTITEITTEITTEINKISCVSENSPENAVKVSNKKGGNPEISQFMKHAFSTYQNKFNNKLHITGDRDGNIIKNLFETYTLTELEQYWDAYIDMSDEYIASQGYTIALFSYSLNKVIAWYSQRQKADRMAYKPSYHVEMT